MGAVTARHLSEELVLTTVRLEGALPDGSTSTGTGFFYSVPVSDDRSTIAIITNRHVLNLAQTVQFHVSLADDAGQPLVGRYHTFRLSDLQAAVIWHPDPAVDLCALPCAGLISVATQMGASLLFRCLNGDLIPTPADEDSLSPLEPILMVGYPNGLWDEVNNRPLLRRGATATQPSVDLNGRGEFLIDAACFPGSSGSPVMLWREPGHVDRHGNLNSAQIVSKLLGVLFAGPIVTVTGDLLSNAIVARSNKQPIVGIPMNLGYVVKSRYIRDMEPTIVERALATA